MPQPDLVHPAQADVRDIRLDGLHLLPVLLDGVAEPGQLALVGLQLGRQLLHLPLLAPDLLLVGAHSQPLRLKTKRICD